MLYIRRFSIAATISLIICISTRELVLADSIPDNSLGSSPSIVTPNQIVNGVPSEIVSGGTQRGGNLFHSFREYSVSPGKGSYFFDPSGVKFIFVRVTGNSTSQIDGTLGVLGGNANLFLINPKGIHFGENARLDLDGSFTASTADRLLFRGYEFSASTPRDVPTLSIEIPIGLGFNGGNGDITVSNKGFTIYQPSGSGKIPPTALEHPPSGLSVKPGKTLSLIGSDITFKGGVINLNSGNINIGGVRKGIVNIFNTESGIDYKFDHIEEYGNIYFLNKSLVLLNTTDGFGYTKIFGDDINLIEGSSILLSNFAGVDAKYVLIYAKNNFVISGDTTTPIPEGFYRVNSGLISSTFGEGRGGDINVFAHNVKLEKSSLLLGATFSSGKGTGGNINISSDTISINDIDTSLTGYSTIGTYSTDNAKAGDINIFAGGISLSYGGRINSTTFGKGDGGDINIKSNYILADGYNLLNFGLTSIASFTVGEGNSGSITIDTQTLKLLGGANLGSSTFDRGNAKRVKISANYISVGGGTLPIRNGKSFIFSSGITLDPITAKLLFGTDLNLSGSSGNLEINANTINLYDGGSFSVSNDAGGNVGNLTVNSNQFILKNANISAISNGGNNGIIEINSDKLILVNSKISTSSNLFSNGGDIIIKSKVLAGNQNSSIQAKSKSGKGGKISISTEALIYPINNITAESGKDIFSNGTIQIDAKSFAPSQKLSRNFLKFSQPSAIDCNQLNRNSSFYTLNKDFTEGLDDSLDASHTINEIPYFIINGEKIEDIRLEGWVKNSDGTARGNSSNIGFSGNSPSSLGCKDNAKIAQLPPRIDSPKLPESPKLIQPSDIPTLDYPQNDGEKSIEQLSDVIVKEFKFTGNTIISTKEINYLVKPYIGKPLSIPELNKILNSITKLYTDRGYINSGARALIKDNLRIDPNNATILIRIVEGYLGRVNVSGSKRLAGQIKWKLKNSKPLNKSEITKQLFLLQEDLPIEMLEAKLIPSEAANIANLEVIVKPANPYEISVFGNNYQNPSVGREQYGIDFSASNPTMLGDKLRLIYSRSEASNLISASYNVPILPDGTAITGTIAYGQNKVITQPYRDLEIKSKATNWSIGINHPIINAATPESRFKFSVGFSYEGRKTQESLLGFNFPISAGSDNDGRRNINTFTLSQNIEYKGKNQAFNLDSNIDIGVDINTKTGPGFANNQAISYRLNHEYVRKIARNTFFIANGGLQFSLSPLVIDRQFSLGGVGSVRGIQQGEVTSDNGVYEQISFKKQFELGKYNVFSVAPFFDIGYGWNTRNENGSKLLYSSGLAFEYLFRDNITANLTLAVPLSENTSNIQIIAGVKFQF